MCHLNKLHMLYIPLKLYVGGTVKGPNECQHYTCVICHNLPVQYVVELTTLAPQR